MKVQRSTHIYEQIIHMIQEQIASGIYTQDEMIPSVRSLASSLSINPNTVQRAYQELERNDMLYVVPKKGYFVKNPSTSLQKIQEELKENCLVLFENSKECNIEKETILEWLSEVYT